MLSRRRESISPVVALRAVYEGVIGWQHAVGQLRPLLFLRKTAQSRPVHPYFVHVSLCVLDMQRAQERNRTLPAIPSFE